MTGALALTVRSAMSDVTPGMVQSAEMIVIGRFGAVSATGSANAHINVEEVLKGQLATAKQLVVVYRARQEHPDFKPKYIFFLKQFSSKESASDRKFQTMQFLGPDFSGLEEATDQRVAQVRRLLTAKTDR